MQVWLIMCVVVGVLPSSSSALPTLPQHPAVPKASLEKIEAPVKPKDLSEEAAVKSEDVPAVSVKPVKSSNVAARKPFIRPGKPTSPIIRPMDKPANRVTENPVVTTTTTTTTLDPLTEFCKEACEAGVGGPECDCPEHPIG